MKTTDIPLHPELHSIAHRNPYTEILYERPFIPVTKTDVRNIRQHILNQEQHNASLHRP